MKVATAAVTITSRMISPRAAATFSLMGRVCVSLRAASSISGTGETTHDAAARAMRGAVASFTCRKAWASAMVTRRASASPSASWAVASASSCSSLSR